MGGCFKTDKKEEGEFSLSKPTDPKVLNPNAKNLDKSKPVAAVENQKSNAAAGGAPAAIGEVK